MEEQLISFETAKLAKEKGFDIITKYSWYIPDNSKPVLEKHKSDGLYYISAPTQSLLQRWLREVHIIEVFVKKGYGYEWYIEDTGLEDGTYNSYGEALEAGFKYALKLIK